jgi:hypothetical protein
VQIHLKPTRSANASGECSSGSKFAISLVRQYAFAFASLCVCSDVTGYDKFDQFKFEVACGVLVFIYTLVLMAVYTFRPSVERMCLYLPVIELVLDGVFCVLLLAAGGQ